MASNKGFYIISLFFIVAYRFEKFIGFVWYDKFYMKIFI